MKLISFISNILKMIWEWILNLFKKEKKLKKNYIINKQKNSNTKKPSKQYSIFNEETNKGIKAIIQLMTEKELFKVNKKLLILQDKLKENNDIYLKEELQDIKNITILINNNYLYQFDKINYLLDTKLLDQGFELNTKEKINILKDEISTLIDDNSKELNNIIDKAYFQYDKVNYVIVTTLLIDEIVNNFNDVISDIKKNKYNKYDYLHRIKEIKEKIEQLEKINNKEDIKNELYNLKKDLYTKQKDKYDLLFNDEIFKNIKLKCDKLSEELEKKEKSIIKEKNQQKEVLIEQKKEINQAMIEKKKRKKKKKDIIDEQDENIIKRFKDLELAFNILKKREENRRKIYKKDVVVNTFDSYQDFLLGELNSFNFLRNKLKTEVAKLYNDTLYNICELEESIYIPIEHINIKFNYLIQETIDNQERLAKLILEKKKVDITTNPVTVSVNQKLEIIHQKEKEREALKEKPKVYVRTYKKANTDIEINEKKKNDINKNII